MSAPILITGVGKRIGLYLATRLQGAGYDVIGTYRRHYPSITALQRQGVDCYPCDFNDQRQLEALIAAVKTDHRQLRGIIHNASDWLPESAEMPADERLQRMFRVHVSAPYQLNLALVDQLRACNTPHRDIIHLTDYVASRGSKKHIAYAASKAALDNLTLSFASQLAPDIKVNSIAPAMIKFNPQDDPDYRQKALGKALIPIEPGEQEVYQAVRYLLESRYVTGRTLHVDGGRHLR